MPYQCQDCSYRAKDRFPEGRCPACDSYNVRRTGGQQSEAQKSKKTTLEIVALVLFWGILLWGIWDRYIKTDAEVVKMPEQNAPIDSPPTESLDSTRFE